MTNFATEKVLVSGGLRGDWLNGWLAALGVVVLVPEARLSWTADARPRAALGPRSADLAEAIAAALPDATGLEDLSIAKRRMGRIVNLPTYYEAADRVRTGDRSDFSLGMSVTDLAELESAAALPHSRFDPPAPQGQTLWDRVVRCRESLGERTAVVAAVAATLEGRGRRKPMNGLGFDVRRLAAAVHGGDERYVDPVVECLAFFGLSLLPTRGDGAHELGRGWHREPGKRGRTQFHWPIWEPALDRWGVDALLGAFHAALADSLRPPRAGSQAHRARDAARFLRLGVTGCYQAVPYRQTSTLDATRGFGSSRLW